MKLHYFENKDISDNVKRIHYHPKGKDLSLVISGKFKYHIDGEEVILGRGDFVCINSNVNEALLEVIEPGVSVVIRTPSVMNNKVFV